jgi:lipoprotein-anchoring transpeptidase ErfK/SrfK
MYKLRIARGAAMTLLAALMLGGCMQATLAPTPEAGWKTRDRELMSNLPYKQAAISEEFRRHIVDYSRKEAPGTIVVDTDNKFLYYVLPKGQAIRYGVTVGEQGQAWGGIATVGRMEEWPPWRPTAGEQARLGPLPAFVTGGPQIRWVRAGYISTSAARTRSTVSTVLTSPNISAEPYHRAASA